MRYSTESKDYATAMVVFVIPAVLLYMPKALEWPLEQGLLKATFEMSGIMAVGAIVYFVMACLAYGRESRHERRRRRYIKF